MEIFSFFLKLNQGSRLCTNGAESIVFLFKTKSTHYFRFFFLEKSLNILGKFNLSKGKLPTSWESLTCQREISQLLGKA